MATATKPARKSTPRRAPARTSSQSSVESLVRAEIKILGSAVTRMEKEFERFLAAQRAANKKPAARSRKRTTKG